MMFETFEYLLPIEKVKVFNCWRSHISGFLISALHKCVPLMKIINTFEDDLSLQRGKKATITFTREKNQFLFSVHEIYGLCWVTFFL